jgi:hypothetical protein
MAISNNARGSQPGVCTSTTRPTAPYEGQTIYETDTDLTYIWGGSAWQQVSGGTAVGNSGLVYITGGSLSGSATNFQGCFTSAYRNYHIVIDRITPSAGVDVYMRYMTGATPNAGANYYYSHRAFSAAGATLDVNGAGINAGFVNLRLNASGATGNIIMDIFDPQLATITHCNFKSQSSIAAGYVFSTGGMSFDAATVFDGFQITTLGGTTLTGNCSIYGYRQA